MTISRNRLFGLLALLGLVFILPLILFLARTRQDIRPRALSGAANFHLNTATTNIFSGNAFNITVSMELTNANVKASGVDFTLLYDSSKLKVLSISPLMGNAWTDTPVVLGEGNPVVYPSEGNGQYGFVRVALVSKKANADLPGGTIPLATVTLQALPNAAGAAIIKFPNDSSVLQVVGSGI